MLCGARAPWVALGVQLRFSSYDTSVLLMRRIIILCSLSGHDKTMDGLCAYYCMEAPFFLLLQLVLLLINDRFLFLGRRAFTILHLIFFIKSPLLLLFLTAKPYFISFV